MDGEALPRSELEAGVATLRSLFANGARVGVTGAAGSGKTTFIRRLSFETGACVHQENAREWLAERNIEAYWEMEPARVAEMQLDLLARLETSTAGLFDRFSADCIFFVQRGRDLLDGGYAGFERRARQFAANLDAIVFFPYYADYLLEDQVRRVDHRYQVEAASTIFLWLLQAGLEEKILVFRHDLPFQQNAEALRRHLSRACSLDG